MKHYVFECVVLAAKTKKNGEHLVELYCPAFEGGLYVCRQPLQWLTQYFLTAPPKNTDDIVGKQEYEQ